MERENKLPLPKKKVLICTTRKSATPKKSGKDVFMEDKRHRSGHLVRRKECSSIRKSRSISDLIAELMLDQAGKENMFDPLTLDDVRKKPDLWMAAFDNPIDFIEYCRKRLEHERGLLENSRQIEEEILQFVKEWTKNTNKHATILQDLYKVQDINDKLQEVVMEERTHCQHLIGTNDKLETQRQILTRKYHAALLLGKVDDKSVRHLLEKNPRAVPLADKLNDLDMKIKQCDRKKITEVADPGVLVDRVQSLERYVDDLMKQHREEVTVLKETINQGDLKCESIKSQYTDLLQRNAKSLNEMKEILGASIRENLDLRQELLKRDSDFFDLHVNETSQRLTKPKNFVLAANCETINCHCKSFCFETPAAESSIKKRDCEVKLAKCEIELGKKANLLRETVNKVVILERKCARIEEENHFLRKSNAHCVKSLKSKNEVLEKRCEKTESRLKLENAGVLHDIREFKTLTKLLIRNVKLYNKDLNDVKKKLMDCTKKVSLGAQPIETLQPVICSTTQFQTNSELRMHAMNLWVDYLEQRASGMEEEISSSRNDQQDSDNNICIKPIIGSINKGPKLHIWK